MQVRAATADELPAVRSVIDGALLQADTDHLARALEAGDLLVAVSEAGTVLGALVLDGSRITAVAVRRRRRDQGIGTALVTAAARERETLVAAFDGRVAPFWQSLGFGIERLDKPDRFQGRLDTSRQPTAADSDGTPDSTTL